MWLLNAVIMEQNSANGHLARACSASEVLEIYALSLASLTRLIPLCDVS